MMTTTVTSTKRWRQVEAGDVVADVYRRLRTVGASASRRAGGDGAGMWRNEKRCEILRK